MKISVNNELLFELTDVQENIIKHCVKTDAFDQDMKRRIMHALHDKLGSCFRELKAEWEPKLIASGATSLPTDPEAFAELVFSHPDYKDRATRDAR